MSSRQADWGTRAKKKPSTRVEVADHVALDVAPAVVWSRLKDVEAVAGCLPGMVPGSLQPTGQDEYSARLEHSAMGLTAHWDLRARMELAETERVLRVHLAGEDPKLGLTMNGIASVVVVPEGAASAIDYTGVVTVEGGLAGVGRPIIKGIIGDALNRFVAAASGTPEPVVRRGRTRRLLERVRTVLRRRG